MELYAKMLVIYLFILIFYQHYIFSVSSADCNTVFDSLGSVPVRNHVTKLVLITCPCADHMQSNDLSFDPIYYD